MIEQINPVVRGWANYFRYGNSSRALGSVKYHVERKVCSRCQRLLDEKTIKRAAA